MENVNTYPSPRYPSPSISSSPFPHDHVCAPLLSLLHLNCFLPPCQHQLTVCAVCLPARCFCHSPSKLLVLLKNMLSSPPRLRSLLLRLPIEYQGLQLRDKHNRNLGCSLLASPPGNPEPSSCEPHNPHSSCSPAQLPERGEEKSENKYFSAIVTQNLVTVM